MITGGGGGSSVPAIAFGTAAARPAPAAGNANTGYYATDTGEITFSNGVTWSRVQSVGGSFASNAFMDVNSGDFDVTTAGRGLRVAEGSNAKQGTATLAAGTVVVANTNVTATSRIMLTPQDNNTAGALRVSARTAGTSFTILSSNAADTGVVAYEIFEPG